MEPGVDVKIRFNAVKAEVDGTGRIQVLNKEGKTVCGAAHIFEL
jgi:hypothetical protein